MFFKSELQVDLDFYDGLEEVDTSHYIQSTEWDLVGHPAKKNLKYYPCCEEPYPDLTFHLHIKRMENFYAQVFIVPAVALSLLTPVIFALPSAGAHRYVLGKYQHTIIILAPPSADAQSTEMQLDNSHTCTSMFSSWTFWLMTSEVMLIQLVYTAQ